MINKNATILNLQMKADIADYVSTGIEYVETPTAKKIASALQYGHTGALVVICGNPGVGKTFCIKHYADHNPKVWVATMSPAKKGITAALEEIALTVGIWDFILRAAYLEREIIRCLEGIKGLLIIDEADHLRPAALETIRVIREATGIGIVLSGNEKIYSQMTGGSGERIPAFARLYARIGRRLRLNKPLKEDLTAIAEAFGVTGKNEHRFIIQIGQKPGGLHGLIETLRLSVTMAKGQKITLHYLKMAWQHLTNES